MEPTTHPSGAEVFRDAYTDEEVAYVPCPLCGSSGARTLAVEWSLVVARCESCGLGYVRRRVARPEWSYRADRAELVRKYGAYISEDEAHPRQPNYDEIAARLEPFRGAAARLLDVGSHIGFFMRTAARRGWDVVGVEQSPVLAELARTEMGLDVREGYFGDLTFSSEFDAVTFLDVLEHVDHPVATLEHARGALRPGGVVLAKVPHLRWNLLKHRTIKPFRKHMDAFDAREHLLQFTAETLTDAFRRARLEPVALFVPRPTLSLSAPHSLRLAVGAAGRATQQLTRGPNALCPDLCLIGRRPD